VATNNELIRVVDVVKEYNKGEVKALNGCSLTVNRGEVVAIVGSVNYTSTLHTMQSNGMLAYAELSAPVARDGNELDIMIEEAYSLIGKGELDKAMNAIKKAKATVLERLAQPVETEEDEYKHQVLQLKLYDLEWYEAIVLMRQGKVIKAKRMLKSIASSSSPYANMAKTCLN